MATNSARHATSRSDAARFRGLRRTMLIAPAVYGAAAAVLTWPLVLHLTDRLGALQGPGDPYLNLWILGWGLRAWTSDWTSITSGRVFDANIFHPAENTLAYSDHFLLQSLALSPLYALTGDIVLCYNVLLLLSIALSGLAMHALVRAVTGSLSAAYLGGLVWACWPYRTAHLLHLQLQALYFMPLVMLCVHRLVAGRRWRDAMALGVTGALQAAASVYYGLMTGIVVTLSAIALAVSTGQWRNRRLWARFAAAGAIALLLALPAVLPYVRSQQAEGFGRTMFEAANHSAAAVSYLQVPPSNLLYGVTGVLAARPAQPGSRDRTGVEHLLFPGVVVVALAAVGLSRGWGSDAQPLVTSALALAGVGVLLSFGPEGIRGVYAALHDNVYGFQAIRAPARFAVIAVLGLTLLAALGLRAVSLTARTPHLAAMLVVLAAVEYLNAPLPLVAAPRVATEAGRWLKADSEAGAVLYLPLAPDLENTPFMVQSLEHGRPIVNGYSGQRPPFFSAVVEALSDMPSREALATLKELHVKFVVSPTPLAGADRPGSALVERARFRDAVVYELRWTPAAVAALGELPATPPPPPGIPPFSDGETALYDVYWDGGPLNLPAGRATMRVKDGAASRWAFDVTAETADWVSNFFQARDRFATSADEQLEPLEHTREIREGRRRLDRTFIFDRSARVVRVGESAEDARRPDALALPLGAPPVRDAITALYYIRTLALEPGHVVDVPVNEAGTSLLVRVAVGDRESIEVAGASYRTLRVEPRVMRRIERRRPMAMILWLSDDDRRVPVRAVVDAGFGRVRLDLVDYRRD